MKYSELISFNPIEDVIQLTSADNSDKAREYVRTYVMSDVMADNLKTLVLDQLQMDEVVDNKGILIVGNYGTGKSHLMSLISAVANDADNVRFLQNKRFAGNTASIAGKFEVLRFELTGVSMPLREIVMGFIEDDFAERGISFKVPDLSKVKDNKKLMQDVMVSFAEKYPDKGYLIVVDELLNYLSSRDTHQLVLDLEFLRVMGEMCSKSKLRCMFGMQEKLFDNPKFGFVADTLGHVRDRITEMVIAKEDTSYVVSERILKKTPEQKALIRDHLEKFSGLYSGMTGRIEEYVEMFPIHPSYVDIFNRLYLIENRAILKNISVTIKEIFGNELPDDAPGIISFDDYWKKIKQAPVLRTYPEVRRVLDASEKLEDIIEHAFPKPAYKPLALKIIYALSVHRLTTNGLDVQFGLTAENLKDDLCLFLQMPEQDADFLLSIIKQTLNDIMTTVSGQFIIFNDANNQYYIDVNKIVDYDEKIKQRAALMSDDELNHYFYKVVYYCLEWNKKQYVTNFEIYEKDLNWASHNIFREGYFFMGLPGERSTAQPARDFYIHIMPPYGQTDGAVNNLQDEVYLYFKSNNDFRSLIEFYAAANSLAQISEGKDKDAYLQKASAVQKKMIRFLVENKNTCFDISYKGKRQQLIEVLKGKYNRDLGFEEVIDLAVSICLDGYFNEKYPEFPVMETKITRANRDECVRKAYDHFAGRKDKLSEQMLRSFGLLDGDKIRPEKSKYALYFINLLKKLPPQGVLNYSDIFDPCLTDMYVDKKFGIDFLLTPIIFLSLVYGGYAVITMNNGKTITASTLDQIPKTSSDDLREFKYLSKPAQMPMAEIKKLFEILNINPALIDNPNDHNEGVTQLLAKAQARANTAVVMGSKINNGFELWGEPLTNAAQIIALQKACRAVQEEFSNYSVKYNTPAKLNNFGLSMEQIETLKSNIEQVKKISSLLDLKQSCSDIVSYISGIEFLELGEELKSELDKAKAEFRAVRDSIMDGESSVKSAQKIEASLSKVKGKYIDLYFESHKKKRLDINEAKRRGKMQESGTLANLRKLRSVEILSGAKLTAVENDMSALVVCYELTPEELKSGCVCPHCRYQLGEKAINVHGRLDDIEERIYNLEKEWTKNLLDTLSDPLVLSQKDYLSKDQQKAVDEFISSEKLPKHVDEFFVKAINSLLTGFEPVTIDPDELVEKLEQLPPMDEDAFKTKLAELLKVYTKGKDASKLRIVIKRK